LTSQDTLARQTGAPDPAIVHKYRELVGLMADERTLRGRQLEDLEASMRALGIGQDDVQTDVEALLRHRTLAAQLADMRAHIEKLEAAVSRAVQEVRHHEGQLQQAQARQADAVSQVRAARMEIAELDGLERDNPRLFAP
jgi:chromosome segregation ATPase